MKTITILMFTLIIAGCLEMVPAHNWPGANHHEHVNDSMPIPGDQAYVELYPDGCGAE